MKLQFEVEGVKEISAKLDMLASVKDFSEPFRASKKHLDRGVQRNYHSQGSYFGQRWQKLSAPYRHWKAKHYTGRGILVRTGALRKGFVGQVSSTGLIYTNLVSYYSYHQSSAPRSTNLPRRVMLKLTNEMRTEIFREFTKFMYKKEKEQGFRI